MKPLTSLVALGKSLSLSAVFSSAKRGSWCLLGRIAVKLSGPMDLKIPGRWLRQEVLGDLVLGGFVSQNALVRQDLEKF